MSNFSFYFLFILPGIILGMIIYYLAKYLLNKKKAKKPDIIDVLEEELKRIKDL